MGYQNLEITQSTEQLANIDQMLKGRFAINIINSDLPGLREDPVLRYRRCAEIIEILKQAWTQDQIDFTGELYKFKMPASPVKPYQQNGGPLLYFGGTSDGSRDVCARYCDVFLTWPEREEMMYDTMQDMTDRAVLERYFPVVEVDWSAVLNRSLRNSTVIWIWDSVLLFFRVPLKKEAEYFSQLVLPYLTNASLSDLQNRIPKNIPVTPLTTAILE